MAYDIQTEVCATQLVGNKLCFGAEVLDELECLGRHQAVFRQCWLGLATELIGNDLSHFVAASGQIFKPLSSASRMVTIRIGIRCRGITRRRAHIGEAFSL